MKYIYTSIGLLLFAIGITGAILPILPTTPFLLLSSVFFLKGSDRVNDWFIHTKLYQQYGNKEALKTHKYKILIPVVIWLIIVIFLVDSLLVQTIIIILITIKIIYFTYVL